MKNNKFVFNKNNYNSNGITLIALVVTIIVLIILATISINLLLGDNGVITKAIYAKEQYEMAQAREKIEMAIVEIETEEISNGRETTLDTLLTNLGAKLKEITISKEGNELKGSYEGYNFTIDDTFKVTIDGEAARTYTVAFNGENITSSGEGKIDENGTYQTSLTLAGGYKLTGLTVRMGRQVLEENIGYTYSNGTISIQNANGNIEIIATTEPITLSDLKAGDYIKYDTKVEGVGEILCRVLYDLTSPYGFQIVSENKIADVKLGEDSGAWETGKTAYNEAIKTLNAEAEKYLNEELATDARCVGSLPTIDENGKLKDKNLETTDTEEFEWSKEDSGCKIEDENYLIDYEEMKKIGTNGIHISGEYWLASRETPSPGLGSIEFNVRYIDASGEAKSKNLCAVYDGAIWYGFAATSGLRPCFLLDSNVKITGGDGTSEKTAYTLAPQV